MTKLQHQMTKKTKERLMVVQLSSLALFFSQKFVQESNIELERRKVEKNVFYTSQFASEEVGLVNMKGF